MRYWCSEGCGFVQPNHRCEQWTNLSRIPTEAELALRLATIAEVRRRVEGLPYCEPHLAPPNINRDDVVAILDTMIKESKDE